MPTREPLSACPQGNAGMTPAYNTGGNTAFVIGANMQDFHTGGGTDEVFVEVCNIDPANSHQLVGSFHQGSIVAPNDLFYQTIAPQQGWMKILGGDIMLTGTGLAFGVPTLGDQNYLNIRGFVNRIVDPRKQKLSAANAYNQNIKIIGTSAGAATLLHNAVSGTAQIDEVYVNLTNTSLATVLATLCIGGTSSACQMMVNIPPQTGWTVGLNGESLNNGLAVSAFAATANVLNARGWINRLS
jgi:hypothetical protein